VCSSSLWRPTCRRGPTQRCSGVAHLSISVGLFPPKPFLTRNVLVSQYTSDDDLAEAMPRSPHPPVVRPRDHRHLERAARYGGYFTNAQPRPPSSSASYIASNRQQPEPWTAIQLGDLFRLMGNALGGGSGSLGCPSSFPKVRKQVQWGRSASAGSTAAAAAEAAPGAQGPAVNMAAFQTAAAAGLEIAPEIFQPSGIAPGVWDGMMVLPR